MSKAPPALPEAPVGLQALSWETGHPERRAWSQALLAAVAANLSGFNHAQDIPKFWAGYGSATDNIRIKFWAELMIAMAYYESGWKPTETYQEPGGSAGPGTLSVGLLQLSKGDARAYGMPTATSDEDLKDPVINLQVGAVVLSHLIARDGCIQNGSNKGGARYWSVLRDGHHPTDIAARVNAAMK